MSATPIVQTNLNRWVGIGIVEAGQNTRMENADMHIGQVLDGKQVSRFWLAQSYFNTMSCLSQTKTISKCCLPSPLSSPSSPWSPSPLPRNIQSQPRHHHSISVNLRNGLPSPRHPFLYSFNFNPRFFYRLWSTCMATPGSRRLWMQCRTLMTSRQAFTATITSTRSHVFETRATLLTTR